MAKQTTRDRLWTYAMTKTIKKGESIDAPKLAKMAGCSERSARDVLKTMTENEILRSRKPGDTMKYISNWDDT